MRKILINRNFKNIKLLLTGSIVSQAVVFLFSPILLRLYSPEELGIYSTLLALVTFFVPLVSGRIDYLIVPEREETKVRELLKLSISLTLISVTTIFVIILTLDIFNSNLYNGLNWILYGVPLIILLNALNNIFTQYNNRLEQYKELSNISVYKSFTQIGTQAFFGLFGLGTVGLIFSLLVSSLTGLTKQIKISIGKITILLPFKTKQFLKSINDYSEYIKVSIPAALLSSLSLNITVPLLTFQYGAIVSGYYYIAAKVLALPVQLFGLTVGKIFYKNASREYVEESKITKSFYSTLIIAASFLLPMCILIYIFSDYVDYIFGKEWIEASVIIKILVPFYLIRGITLSIILTPYVVQKVKMDFLNQLGILISVVISFLIVLIAKLTYIEFFVIYSVLGSLIYLIILINCVLMERKLFKGSMNKILR